MRYFFSGLGIFLLLALFMRSWYVHLPQDNAGLSSPPPKKEFIYSTPLSDSFEITPKENYLLRPEDYETIEKVAGRLYNHPQTCLRICFASVEDSVRLSPVVLTVFADLGLEATQVEIVRTPHLPKGTVRFELY